MKLFNTFAILLMPFIAVSCKSSEFDRLATEYSQRSPINEAQADFNEGDFRIFSAMGVGRYYPGLDQKLGFKIAQKHGERMLEATTDAPESDAHSRYIGSATDFAECYNKRKIELLKDGNH